MHLFLNPISFQLYRVELENVHKNENMVKNTHVHNTCAHGVFSVKVEALI